MKMNWKMATNPYRSQNIISETFTEGRPESTIMKVSSSETHSA
jgi:hypothetical protein